MSNIQKVSASSSLVDIPDFSWQRIAYNMIERSFDFPFSNSMKRKLSRITGKGFEVLNKPVDAFNKVIAIPGRLHPADFVICYVDVLSENRFGFDIVQKEREKGVNFYYASKNQLQACTRDDLELFLPKYPFYPSLVLVGESMPEADTIRYVEEPRKLYVDEEEIIANDPDSYQKVREYIQSKSVDMRPYLLRIEALARKLGIELVDLKSRHKTVGSTYCRLSRTGKPHYSALVPDLNGMRAVVETPDDCYHLFSQLERIGIRADHCLDKIALPKRNAHQRLRMWDTNQSLEVQVQSRKMWERNDKDNFRRKVSFSDMLEHYY